MSNSDFHTQLQELVHGCEQQMIVEGWREPDFDEQQYRLPSGQLCREIDSLIQSSGLIRIDTEWGVTSTHPSRAPLGRASLHAPRVILPHVIESCAISYPLLRQVSSTLGYIGIKPFKEELDTASKPYVGPYAWGIVELAGKVTFDDNGCTRNVSFQNPYGLFRLRTATFSDRYLEISDTQKQHNHN